ncbi:hypothetical protein FA15DRAFT_662534 [Coprinopsis marcescibilis]|uniref:DUF6697 domain-containing protein n=1 Tax=Coprinopsis marcescibilis TaxID=230819 RepID=A0A5C3LF84_COPMA|nr:hypothetical protein FA15DRAFT_662534 [Coprinopsis marcescibilis]
MNTDDPFWNQVVQRWADATQESKRLKDEKSVLERERNELQQQLDRLGRDGRDMRNDRNSEQKRDLCANNAPDPVERSVDLGQLQALESGIQRAQESYKKIEEQLRENNGKIQDLANNNERLRRERSEVEGKCQGLSQELERTRSSLQDALKQNELLRKQLSASTRVSRVKEEDPEMTITFLPGEEIEKLYKPRIASLERNIETLSRANLELKHDNKRMQQELDIVSQKLSKYKNTNQSFQDKLVKLGELTRQKTSSLHSRTSSLASGSQMDARSIKSERTPSTSSRLRVVSAPGHRPPIKAPARLAVPPTIIDLTNAEDGTPDEDQAPTPRPPFTTVKHTPLSRRNQLSGFPTITPNVVVSELSNAFSREFMTSALGGSIQPLIVRVARQGNIAKKTDIHSYLCPSLDHNPWCPTAPGHHGYIFVGLGREKTTFAVPEIHNVFAGLSKTKSKDTRRFRYLGKYEAVRVSPLSVAEWNSLDLRVRSTYAKTTKEKTKDSRPSNAIIGAYDNGELRVPCVQLKCIGFDEELYSALVAEANASSPTNKSASSGSQPSKRALDDYEADIDSTRKRRTMAKAS